MDGSYYLERGPINESHPGTRRVYAARLYLALPNLALELFEIERGLRQFTTQHRTALAMDDLMVRVPTSDLIVDLAVVVRQQRDADLFILADDDRLRPDRIVQFQH